MRAIVLVLMLAACLPAAGFARERQPSIYSALHRCPLRGLATSDNDVRLDKDLRPRGRKAPLPAGVAEVIYRAASKDLRSQDRDIIAAAVSDCGDTFGEVYRLDAPNGLQIYVGRDSLSIGGDNFHLVVFDPVSRAVSTHPLWLSAKWTEGFGFANDIAKPPVFRFDRGMDGTVRLVFAEYSHNGNVYNSIVDRYFEMGANLSLNQVMTIEKISLISNGDGLIVRRPREIAPGRVKVSVYEQPKQGPDRKLGSYELTRERAGQAYRVVNRHVLGSASMAGLVDGCESATDEEFERVGCDFYY